MLHILNCLVSNRSVRGVGVCRPMVLSEAYTMTHAYERPKTPDKEREEGHDFLIKVLIVVSIAHLVLELFK